jgi:hypothetical protein
VSEGKLKPFAPVVISILGAIGWLIFILLYSLFWSMDFTFFQNVITTIVSFLIVALLIGLMWVVWGFREAGWGID